jgi:hypothetical protein
VGIRWGTGCDQGGEQQGGGVEHQAMRSGYQGYDAILDGVQGHNVVPPAIEQHVSRRRRESDPSLCLLPSYSIGTSRLENRYIKTIFSLTVPAGTIPYRKYGQARKMPGNRIPFAKNSGYNSIYNPEHRR